MFGAFETNFFGKSRVMRDTSWASIDEAIAYFVANGAFAERDPDGFEAADLFNGRSALTGLTWRVEAV